MYIYIYCLTLITMIGLRQVVTVRGGQDVENNIIFMAPFVSFISYLINSSTRALQHFLHKFLVLVTKKAQSNTSKITTYPAPIR